MDDVTLPIRVYDLDHELLIVPFPYAWDIRRRRGLMLMHDVHLRRWCWWWWRSLDLGLLALVLTPPLRPLGFRGSGLPTFAPTLRLCIATVGFGDMGDALGLELGAMGAGWSSYTTPLQGTATLAGHDEGCGVFPA